MVILVKPVQPLNALYPIEMTEFGMDVFLHPNINLFDAISIIALQLSRESYTVLLLSTTIDSMPVQPANANHSP